MHSTATAFSTFTAALEPVGTANPLTVSRFIAGQKPGSVAVCLSGGGSRALSAGMGQLNALQGLAYAKGGSLFEQVLALSTVSGGSWLGVPFVYLPSSVSDTDYLGGAYVPPASLTKAGLHSLPSGCAGSHINNDFTIVDLLVQAIHLHWEGVPADMLWQTIIGLHLLAPYGLYTYGSHDTPNSFFTFDQASLDAIVAQNPSLANETANLVSGQPRPFLVCNTAMFVNTPSGASQLAPVQGTSFMTGVVSTPPGAVDANGNSVGGGGVNSFAFSSTPISASGSQVTVAQARQFALMDIVGSSSAAYADMLRQFASMLLKQPEMMAQMMLERGPAARSFLARNGVVLTSALTRFKSALTAHALGHLNPITDALSALTAIIPAYEYWPVSNVPTSGTLKSTQFADGGSLENLGIASVLAYGDVSNLVSFINTSTAISLDDNGIIVVDSSVPPLFGYQPYVEGTGYAPFSGGATTQNSQVFPSGDFQPLLNALWAASGSGTYQTPPIYSQALTTVANSWFGVAGGRSVVVVWVYLERVRQWYDQLPHDVKDLLGPFDSMLDDFPHYSTVFGTELSPLKVNLLANLTNWVVRQNPNLFQALFS